MPRMKTNRMRKQTSQTDSLSFVKDQTIVRIMATRELFERYAIFINGTCRQTGHFQDEASRERTIRRLRQAGFKQQRKD